MVHSLDTKRLCVEDTRAGPTTDMIARSSDAYFSASRAEGTKCVMTIFSVADTSDLPYMVVLF